MVVQLNLGLVGWRYDVVGAVTLNVRLDEPTLNITPNLVLSDPVIQLNSVVSVDV